MFKKIMLGLLLACFTSTASATTLIVDENGTATSYTQNKDALRTRAIPYHLKGTIPVGNIYIPKGTQLRIVPQAPINGGYLEQGDIVNFELCEDFIINGNVMAPKGTIVKAKVWESQHSWWFDHGGNLCLRAEELYLANGTRVPVDFHFHEKIDIIYEGSLWRDSSMFTGKNIFSQLAHAPDVKLPTYKKFVLTVAEDTDLGIPVNEPQAHTMAAPVVARAIPANG